MSVFTWDASGELLRSLTAKIGTILLLYGAGGLFAMSFLDSSLVPFPVLNDLALIMMAATGRPGGPSMRWRVRWARCAATISFMALPAAEGSTSFARRSRIP